MVDTAAKPSDQLNRVAADFPSAIGSSFTFSELTPPGRGAIASLRLEGPGAKEAVERWFQPNFATAGLTVDRLFYGRFGPPPAESVVLRWDKAGRLEIHCHGGRAAAARIVGLLAEAGGKPASWSERLSVEHSDPLERAAMLALTCARTERAALVLLDQYRGALRRAWDLMDENRRRGDLLAVRQQAGELLRYAALGLHLADPWQVTIGGPANAGKSSLINALLGYQRAIVWEQPGTTRDIVTATTALDGWPVEFSDTAGLRTAGDPIEEAGIALAQERLAAADLAILVFDLAQPWTAFEAELCARWPQALVVHNKADLGDWNRARPPGIIVSALSGTGIETLQNAIIRRLVPEAPPPGAPVPFTREQVEELRGWVSSRTISTGLTWT